MSYFDQSNYGHGTYDYVITPEMVDIYAVQEIYGANDTTRLGDTTYGFNSNAGALYNFARYSGTPAFTIYDSGGNDTLDASGYASNQTISLVPGSWSSIGGYVNNIGIYLTTVIENAIGGPGNDIIIGNGVGNVLNGGGGNDVLHGAGGNDTLLGGQGNDVLNGGPGNDVLRGGPGADTFVFSTPLDPATNVDVLPDFAHGVDLIELSHLVFTHLAPGLLPASEFVRGLFAATLAEHVIYSPSTGALAYDANGSRPGGSTVFAVLPAHSAVNYHDFLVV
jgi:serralysin